MQCYIPATGIVRIINSLKDTPKEFSFPKTSTEDYLIQAIGEIISMIKCPPKTPNFLSYGDATKNVINKISHNLQISTAQCSLQILPLPPMLPQIQNKNIFPPIISSQPVLDLRVEPAMQPLRIQTLASAPTSTLRGKT